MIGLNDLLGRMSMRVASVAALGLLSFTLSTGSAAAETRVLKLYNLHTKEKVSIAFKKDGRYLPQGLKDLNWFLRDWRKKEPTQMDKRLLDLIWEAYRQSGSRDYINVICGYRSAGTNNMLRSRSSGVAKESQHTLGRAMDFFIPDVPLKKMREIGLRMEVGGVGYYPKSGSPFVHFDVGNARHWPRMSRKELVAVFPKGNTIHVPSDGKPLPGYEQALAAYKQRKGSSATTMMAAASSRGGGKTLFAALFGGGADEEEDVANVEVAAAQRAPRPEPVAKTPAKAVEPPVAVAALVPTEKPKLLSNGVPLPIRDTFDTTAPTPPAAIAERPAAEQPESSEFAALVPARVPLPQWAPQRAAPAVIAPSVAVASVASPAQRDDVSALMAAVESTSAAQEIAASAPAQMAYAVPTPRSRPPFEAILSGKPASADAIRDIASASVPMPSEMPSRVAATTPAPHALAVTPSQRPVATASLTPRTQPKILPASAPTVAKAAAPRQNLLLASTGSAKPRAAKPAAPLAVPKGKTGRFARTSPAPTSAPAAIAAAVAPSQDAIQSRIEMAMSAAFAD
ncbi:hypothetical protein ASG43_02265 [Aureimonas sp. Leaf454]|uniref:DUF882 domain-containing protein n=1 Tax=Aureimonas sp. Leaf454 TaxID=1736381 RepID=UPI0006FFBEAC|nr:DUF882 domain-containing protein [Aureimonas sp. Leaf454]KQT54446.1 hypothetical protein ASG43_02265 [Aureimonas sp. Leaf454]